MLRVVLWLWHGAGGAWGRYGIEHANRCARMVRANLSLPHELVCITDIAEDGAAYFDAGIRLVQIWNDLADRGRCWRRLKAFAPEMTDIIGERWAWIDLDCVILGDLAPLFERPEDLVLWRSQSTRAPYNGSMVLHTAGTMPEIWERYSPHVAVNYPGSDQAWFAHCLGANMPVWTDRDGVLAYNRYGRRCRHGPPDGARVMFFPGSVKSNSHICRKMTPWVQEILNKYGDFDEPQYHWHPRQHQLERRRANARRFIGASVRQGVIMRE